MKLMLASNGFWINSGYGVQSKHLLPRLRDTLGWDVAQVAWYGLKGGMLNIDGIPIYPGYRDSFGNDVIGEHAKHFGADLVVTLIDIWIQAPNFHASLGGIPHAPWFPVDSEPALPLVVAPAQQAEYPLQYSRFGQDSMRRAGVACTYIPHGVETAVFTPGDKRAARAALGWPDAAFICTMVAANQGQPSRKAFSEQLQAFAQFRKRHPEAMLYLHTTMAPPDGVRIDQLCAALGLAGGDVVRLPNEHDMLIGIDEEAMAGVYQASDVLLGATCAEGFGIPIIEAQACGTPVITTDFSAMPELTVNGICVPPVQRQWVQWNARGLQGGGIAGAWHAVPSVRGITEALETIAGWGSMKRQRNAAAGREFVLSEFDWDACIEQYWRPFLARVAAERGAEVKELVEVGA